MPQHDHGIVDGFVTCSKAPELQAFGLELSQVLGGRRQGRQCAHSALDSKVVAMLEGGVGGGRGSPPRRTHSTRVAQLRGTTAADIGVKCLRAPRKLHRHQESSM